MSTVVVALLTIATILAGNTFIRRHYSEPQRRKRAVRELVGRRG